MRNHGGLIFGIKNCSDYPSLKYGGLKGIRTPGLRIANAALYQLSYKPSTWKLYTTPELFVKCFLKFRFLLTNV